MSRFASNRLHFLKCTERSRKPSNFFGSKTMSLRRQLSVARSAIAKGAIVVDECERNVDTPKETVFGRSNDKSQT